MKINDIKPNNRPMEKMLIAGPQALSNEELLAILINTGTKGKSSLDLSYELINSVNNLKSLLNLSIQELMEVPGIKKAKACRIEAAFELTRRLMAYENKGKAFLSHKDSASYLYPLLCNKDNENMIILYLNSKCELIVKEEYSGSANYIDMPSNEIVRKCLKYNARGVIVAHNHPNGDVRPSNADIEATNTLQKKLQLFDFIFFDHLIIGYKKYYAFSENECFSLSE